MTTYNSIETTERTRRAIQRSPRSARNLRHAHAGPEHLLLAILADTEAIATRALHKLGVTHDTFLRYVRQQADPNEIADNGSLPKTTEQFRQVVVNAGERAHLDSRTYTGTKHIVAELIANPHTAVAAFFQKAEITLEKFERITDTY